MYRLIMPVIDYANENIGFTTYFEYNQTSSHETYQSVDIALLENQVPKLMIEAKRLSRRVSAEQISKYLFGNEKLRGIVSNGETWILCIGKKNKAINIFPNSLISQEGINEIVSFIKGEELDIRDWKEEPIYSSSRATQVNQIKRRKAKRHSNKINRINDLEDLNRQIKLTHTLSELDELLLKSFSEIFEHIERSGNDLRCEFRSSRLSFFCDSKEKLERFKVKGSKRIARIEFGKKQPDILILSNLVSLKPELSKVVSPTPHDKGPQMRRFRLKDSEQTEAFGALISKLMIKEFVF